MQTKPLVVSGRSEQNSGPRPTGRRLTVGLAGAAILLTPAAAAAAPASPEFLAGWKQADQALAGWDLLAAEKAIEPLLAQNTTLDPVQRIWFDYSAARLLAYLARPAEAERFSADAHAVGSSPGFVTPPAPADPKGKHCMPFPRPRPLPWVPENPSDFRNNEYLLVAHVGGPDFPITHGGVMASYFGEPIISQKPRYYICGHLLIQRGGGATGRQSGTGRYTITVPSKQSIVAKRRIARGGRFQAQAFGVKPASRLIATWTNARTKRTTRTRHRVMGEQVILRAPKQAGTWHLQLGIDRAKDFGTGITSVRVG